MAADLRPYGVAATVRIPLLAANDSNFATNADWTPGAGDVKVSKDGGAQANITTLPSYANGRWTFTLSTAEMEAAVVEVNVIDAALLDDGFTLETYGDTDAQHAINLNLAFADQTYPDMAVDTTYTDFDAAVAAIIEQCATDPPSAEGAVQSGSTTTVVVLETDLIGPESGYVDSFITFIYANGFREGRYITAYDATPPTATLSEALRGTLVVDGSGDNTIYKIYEADLTSSGSGLDAAGVRAAVGLATANLDTQLGALPTATENATELLDTVLSDTARTDGAAATLEQALVELMVGLGLTKIVRSGTTLTGYKFNESTIYKTWTLDSATTPTTRTSAS